MSTLSLCLPFEPPPMGGGGYRFLRSFEAYLTAQQIPWTRTMTKRTNVLFVNSWCTPVWEVLTWKFLHRGLVVHRIDGWPPAYGRTDGIEHRLRRVNQHADLTIYQSFYSCRSTSLRPGVVIGNPVDVAAFALKPPVTHVPYPCVAAVSWSENPLKGGEAIAELAAKHPDVLFKLIGRWPQMETANLHVMGQMTTERLVAVLQSCDALLTMSQHEAGPNHVLEAMACGLPVLYLDSGATKEYVGDGGLPVTDETFRDALDQVLNPVARMRAREQALTHAPHLVFPRYVSAIASRLP